MKKTLTTSLLALALSAAPVAFAAPPAGVGVNRAPPRVVQTAPAQVRVVQPVRAKTFNRAQYQAERKQLVRRIDQQERRLAQAQRQVTQAQRQRVRSRIEQAMRQERQARIALAELRQDLQRLDRSYPRYARMNDGSRTRRG